MFKKVFLNIKDFIFEESKFLICMVVFTIVCTMPVNYYIIVGGGISDIGERISVDDGYSSDGSFNISYVSELKGTVLSYAMSYIIPSWERESMDDYKYSTDEDYEDIAFRGDLDLRSANGSAIKTAYDLALRKYIEVSSKIYVIATFDEYETNLEVGDELIAVNGQSFSTVQEYSKYIQDFKAGDIVTVKVRRDKKEKEIGTVINEDNGIRLFGVALQILKEYETDPRVEINFKNGESGPSGGLITTLEIYNRLVKEDITNSLRVAGTGTVDDKGNVGSIGGVKYKLIGAVKGDADLFLVPAGKNYEEALKVKEEKKLDIKIIPVETVSDAIYKLKKLSE